MERTKSNTTQAIEQCKCETGSDLTTRELDEKPISCRELPREGRPQTLNATVHTYSFQQEPRAHPSEESEHESKDIMEEETTGGTRRSRKPMMPSFNGLRRRLPPPLHSTGTVYTHLTATPTKKTDR
ncbi:hypothetical protein Bca4012_045668 [Brassica carinata]|uniref:BnaC09g37490D protein n=2 Tax=Brassica TaxID=3705 RepID=A0A078HDB2_BRANA|nr:BnaC09g37490D [Brassica napus]VDD33139.1 unnamed protein product [Brassica oleracea]